MEAFKDFYCEIDPSKENIKDEISRILKIAFIPKYSKRPPRILLLGPPSSGKTTIAELLAKRYRLTLVSAGNLLEEEIKGKTVKGQIAIELMEKGEEVSDKVMGKIVEERLNQPDCKVNGWVLEGFPLNEAQARILKQERHTPSTVIELGISDEAAFERSESKRIDPTTGKVYSLTNEDLKPSKEIEANLITKECDSYDKVEKKLEMWKTFKDKINEFYKGKLAPISAEKPIEAVLEAISDEVEN